MLDLVQGLMGDDKLYIWQKQSESWFESMRLSWLVADQVDENHLHAWGNDDDPRQSNDNTTPRPHLGKTLLA